MEIKGKVHCLFEQSGTFKNEFKKLGYNAEDYDIQNNFNETDYVVDLFKAIEDAYDGKPSLFDDITKDDLIIAFFPCTHFCGVSQMWFNINHRDYKNWNSKKIIDYIIEKNNNRSYFFEVLNKFVGICLIRDIRLIVENPIMGQTFLRVFLKQPNIVDNNRMLRGDYMIKPTGYWFFNCNPTSGFTRQEDKIRKEPMKMKSSMKSGLCSEERSMISPDYARNFICDFIIGKEQKNTQLELFKD